MEVGGQTNARRYNGGGEIFFRLGQAESKALHVGRRLSFKEKWASCTISGQKVGAAQWSSS